MIIKVKGVKPVKIGDKWELVDYEREDEYPESAVRHRDLCTACGFTGYPECREWCPNEEIERKKNGR